MHAAEFISDSDKAADRNGIARKFTVDAKRRVGRLPDLKIDRFQAAACSLRNTTYAMLLQLILSDRRKTSGTGVTTCTMAGTGQRGFTRCLD